MASGHLALDLCGQHPLDQAPRRIRAAAGSGPNQRGRHAGGRRSELCAIAGGGVGRPDFVPWMTASETAVVPLGNHLIIWANHGESPDRRHSGRAGGHGEGLRRNRGEATGI